MILEGFRSILQRRRSPFYLFQSLLCLTQLVQAEFKFGSINFSALMNPGVFNRNGCRNGQ
jgi:hypothetical protein